MFQLHFIGLELNNEQWNPEIEQYKWFTRRRFTLSSEKENWSITMQKKFSKRKNAVEKWRTDSNVTYYMNCYNDRKLLTNGFIFQTAAITIFECQALNLIQNYVANPATHEPQQSIASQN